jgi:hypothetical protein
MVDDKQLFIAALIAYHASLNIRNNRLDWASRAERRAMQRAERDAVEALAELKQML